MTDFTKSITRRQFGALGLAAGVASVGLASISPAIAQGRSFIDQDLSEKKFTNAMLDGADFTGATLKFVDFSGASVRGAIFKDADLSNARFLKSDLSGSDFRDSVFAATNNGESNFTRANFENLDLKAFIFGYSNFQGANLRNTTNWGWLVKSNFRNADIRGANLYSDRPAALDDRSFAGAIYDDRTRFPANFDIEKMGGRRAS